MRQRTSGRPSGTDGSDFSYRMVVDSRYTKAAKGRSRLAKLLLIQAFLQLIGLLITFLLVSKDKGLDVIATSSYVAGLIFLLIGELGRRKSRTSFLQLYMSFSTFSIIVPLLRNVTNSSILEDIGDYTNWNLKNFKFIETSMLMLGLVVQLITILFVTSLIGNISLPTKKTS